MDGEDKQTREKSVDEERREWLESLEYVLRNDGPARAAEIIRDLQMYARRVGVDTQCPSNTPYINTIPVDKQAPFPGDRAIERRIKSIIRWNAMVMVVRANREEHGIGGHISTYASAATLFEIGFNHFFKGGNETQDGDIIYFQGHASPGVYARAFLEGRLSLQDLENFRRELKPGGGLSSYPHPWLMPDFWEFPTVSMGLTPIMAIYQARFNHYLQDRGLRKTSGQKIWAFLGDGEMDEPESLGAITLASREKLDDLIFVINCNLQRLDGPVRGNGKIIQELEAAFSGAGWNVIKVIWGSDWDPLLERDKSGLLKKRMDELVDGQMQKYIVSDGDFIRRDFFGKYPELLELVKDYPDEQVKKMVRGGHDPVKVYAAYKAAIEHKGSPTVILAQTIKGYGLGEAGEGKNITHQQKKMNEEELKEFRTRFDIPLSDDHIAEAPFFKPPDDSEEMKYLRARREELGGFAPQRRISVAPVELPDESLFDEFFEGSGSLDVATTMVFVRILSKLLSDKNIGKRIVPIVPDEARTFGMESLFRQVGIYSHVGQTYEPVDRENLIYYREASDGAILEEGITEAGSMCSFIAAGTSYATHRLSMIPFFIFYSMFGLQRTGDLIWAAGDMRTKGFLIGGTSGRSTLAGEGLQHQDGNSHILAYPYPNLLAYDPAYAYELAVIIRDGIRRMYHKHEDVFYYITVMNEFYKMPPMPEGIEEGILKGIYRFRKSRIENSKAKAHLLGSGAILNEALKAADLLEEKYNVAADVWSVTSYKSLYQDAVDTERENMISGNGKRTTPYVTNILKNKKGIFVAASDYVKALPVSIAKWIPGRLIALGTDGFGRSDSRAALRDFFEIDHRFIVLAALSGLADEGIIERDIPDKAIKDLDIDPEKPNPRTS